MPDTLFDLQDRVIAVTGGFGRLGQSFSRCLLDRGALVAILEPEVGTREISKSLRGGQGDRLLIADCDVTSRQSLEAALALIEDRWGCPHGLINNAAIDSPPNASAEDNGPFETYPRRSLDRILNVNVVGVVQACQVIGGRMAEFGRGSIVNVSSIYGIVSPDQKLYEYRRENGAAFYKPVAYSVSKSALLNLTRYLATYWGPKAVRVNTVTFGGVFDDQDPRFRAEYEARVPLGRMASVDDYNGTVVYLLSDASRYMTGSNVVIDGGWTAW
jgi:NAD(P)-dependent dehydrogenase (short-subunit alcohol dehydrogenase family)